MRSTTKSSTAKPSAAPTTYPPSVLETSRGPLPTSRISPASIKSAEKKRDLAILRAKHGPEIDLAWDDFKCAINPPIPFGHGSWAAYDVEMARRASLVPRDMGFGGLPKYKGPQKVVIRESARFQNSMGKKRKAAAVAAAVDGGDDDEDVDEEVYDLEDDAGEEGDDDDDAEGDEVGEDGDDESSEAMPVQEPQRKKRRIDSAPLVWSSASKKASSTKQQTATKRPTAESRTIFTKPKSEDSPPPSSRFL